MPIVFCFLLFTLMSFLYSLFLKLLYPTSLAVLLLLGSALLKKREVLRRICFWLAVALLLLCGNGWVVGTLTKRLEWKYLPPNPMPLADCILVLSGGTRSHVWPRPTVELDQTGQRLLYAAYLYRHRRAPRLICTGNVATGGVAARPMADDMAEFLEDLGVPHDAILLESKAEDTHQHATNLIPVFRKGGFKKVLLVTSALHMARSIRTFRHLCPDVEFIAAPTDFGVTEPVAKPWYHQLVAVIPSPSHLLNFCAVSHEYLGIAYYKIRGWI
jgi:uncharacterized SAM-binding protein YcdF (DUF218 family)